MAGALAAVGNLEATYKLGQEPPNDLSVAMGNLAWVLATHPEATCRNGAEAVRYAELALKISRQKTPMLLDILGASYAEAGRFEEAAGAARQAIELATAAKQQPLVAAIRGRLQLYEAHKPYRLPPPPRGVSAAASTRRSEGWAVPCPLALAHILRA